MIVDDIGINGINGMDHHAHKFYHKTDIFINKFTFIFPFKINWVYLNLKQYLNELITQSFFKNLIRDNL